MTPSDGHLVVGETFGRVKVYDFDVDLMSTRTLDDTSYLNKCIERTRD